MVLLKTCALFCAGLAAAYSESRPVQLDDNANSVNFLVHGDWGWNNYNQSLTAYEMGVYAWVIDAQFVVVLGDNFYEDGVTSAQDSYWNSIFHNVYDIKSLMVPWYAVMGNHDYHGNVSAQILRTYVEGETMWKMPALYYNISYEIPGGGRLAMIFIDTQLLDPFQKDTEAILSDPDWRDKRQAQLDWLDAVLAEEENTATWIAVNGHYPIYSIGEHGDDTYLVNDLLPILLKHNVHAYFSAHDHNHQHFQMDGMHHFITGNSAGRGPFGPHGWQFSGISLATEHIETVFQACGFSFAEVDAETFNVTFVDNTGRVRYTESLTNAHKQYKAFALFAIFDNFGVPHLLAGVAIVGIVASIGFGAVTYMGIDSFDNFSRFRSALGDAASAAVAAAAGIGNEFTGNSRNKQFVELDMSSTSVDRLVARV